MEVIGAIIVAIIVFIAATMITEALFDVVRLLKALWRQ